MIREAHAAQAAVAVTLTTTPIWVSILQAYLAVAAEIMGLLVGALTIYQIIKAWRQKP